LSGRKSEDLRSNTSRKIAKQSASEDNFLFADDPGMIGKATQICVIYP
jgi:hypothetical protein